MELREVGIELELEETDWVAKVRPTLRDRKAQGSLDALPPSKKAVEAQIAAFNAGKALVHQFETEAVSGPLRLTTAIVGNRTSRRREPARDQRIELRSLHTPL